MSVFGLVLLGFVGITIAVTGIPAFIVLIAGAMVGAVVAIVAGDLPPVVFSALPSRLVSLFENDLLQALPLFAAMGVLLESLPVGGALYRAIAGLFRNHQSGPAVTTMVLGGLFGPMNGSVGAQVLGLCRTVLPQLNSAGMPPARAQGLISIASTMGVVIPPSLILILLSDAMMVAHTIALQGTNRTERIINSQDLFRGVFFPALVLFIVFVVIAFLQSRHDAPLSSQSIRNIQPASRADYWIAGISFLVLAGLLSGVALGVFYPVEAAATGGVLLLVYGISSRTFTLHTLSANLDKIMATTGSLFALLVAATSLTLVLRMLGTDHLVARWLLSVPTSTSGFLIIVLCLVALTALVLDAFEIIFVLIPIIAPPLLMRVPDTVWASVAILMTLQLSFLMPPMGYALMMTRGTAHPAATLSDIVRSMKPFLLAQLTVLAVVLIFPAFVHLADPDQSTQRGTAKAVTNDQIGQQLQNMLPDLPVLPQLPSRP
jgi:tripartite ATP-independent transporter DctM subunit